MADDVTGQWGTVSFAIPDYLEDVRDAVNDFAEFLITILEIANIALEFVKAFVKGYLDPLASLLKAIIDEITAILKDLAQIGIYITGDWALLGWPPEDLRGGFSEYERRMIARLTDRTDPTRPDVSSKSKVLGFFGYMSVDPTELERLINFIITIIKMFGLSYWPDTSRMPVPIIRDTLYGPDAVGVSTAFQFGPLIDTLGSWSSPPSLCRVTWITKPPSQKHPLNPFPAVGPSGYLVTVSTLEQGLQLRYSRAIQNTDKKDVDGDKSKKAQPREYGPVLSTDNRPIILHGGAEMLSFKGSDFVYNDQIDTTTGAPKDGACQVFGMLDPASNEVVPLELLTTEKNDPTALGETGDGKGSKFRLQRTFLVTSGVTLAQWFAGEYSAVLHLDDMPIAARFERNSSGGIAPLDDGPATHYYVRVWSAGKEIATGKMVPQWDFKSKVAKPNAKKSGQPFFIASKAGEAGLGMPSAARKITFVNANTKDYLHALETALLILILSRSDMPMLEEITEGKSKAVAKGFGEGKWAGQQFALKATGLEDSRHLLRIMYPRLDNLEQAGVDPVGWRSEIHAKVRQMAQDIYERTGPMPETEAAIVDATKDLRTVTWVDLLANKVGEAGGRLEETQIAAGVKVPPTLVAALDPDGKASKFTEFGIAPNLLSMGMSPEDADELFSGVILGTTVDPTGNKAPSDEGTLTGRVGEYAMWDGGKVTITYDEPDKEKVRALLEKAPASLKQIYQQFIDKDGKLLIPEEWAVYLKETQKKKRLSSSGDMTPVYVSGLSHLVKYSKDKKLEQVWTSAFYLRDMIRDWKEGALYAQAAVVLRVATAAFTRAPQDGEWIAMRLFDAFPELQDFLEALENWVKTLAEAIKSMADAIVKYIEFLQAQIVELQQLIRRINAMIQSLLSFSFLLPEFSGLILFSDGTEGLMADMVAATNKPSDGPRSYGGGVAIVVPAGPSFIYDIIALNAGEDPDPDAMTTLTAAPDAIGIEQIEPSAGAAPTDEPDVL